MKLQYKNIPISKSKRKLAFYRHYWREIQKLIGDNIKTIIWR